MFRLIISAFLASVLFLTRCANPVSPTGGPKDTTPPVIIRSEPPLNSINFSSDKIKITFNEFIQLKDINTQLIISPPAGTAPEFKLRGKSLIIELKDTLIPNTTYNFFIGNSIVDLTENNPIENFQYVFSTGDFIDSLSLSGTLLKADDLTPVKGVNIMLFLNNNDTIVFDSLPYFVKPYYLTKTDASGKFALNNLSNNSYKLFALNDLNANYIYDQPGEEIAFIDSLVTPVYQQDTEPDSVSADSLFAESFTDLISLSRGVRLLLFQESDSTQKLLKASLTGKNHLTFAFKRPVNNLQIQPLNIDVADNWGIEEANLTHDTISYWIRDFHQDSVTFLISDNGTLLDTVSLAVKRKVKERKQEMAESDTTKLKIKTELKTTHSELYKPLFLIFDSPVISYDPASVQLFEFDSIPVLPAFSFVDMAQRKFSVDFAWKGGTPYRLMIYDSAFVDFMNRVNDTIVFSFTTKTAEDYGNLFINLKRADGSEPVILQMMSEGKIIEERIVNESQRISFMHMNPGDYRLKAIIDSNQNGKWDTGDYMQKRQPETVIFFSATITVRSNWDVEEDWDLGESGPSE